MKTSSNDTSGVVWALGEYFFFLFLILTNAFICYYSIIYEICNREDGNDENGPKRRQMRRLGPG